MTKTLLCDEIRQRQLNSVDRTYLVAMSTLGQELLQVLLDVDRSLHMTVSASIPPRRGGVLDPNPDNRNYLQSKRRAEVAMSAECAAGLPSVLPYDRDTNPLFRAQSALQDNVNGTSKSFL